LYLLGFYAQQMLDPLLRFSFLGFFLCTLARFRVAPLMAFIADVSL
jgi:hypothetical protein